MNVSENIVKYLKYKGISINKFSNEIGVSNSYFSKQIKENGSIGSKIIQEIVKKYEDLSLEWLLTGQGDMLKSSYQINNFESIVKEETTIKGYTKPEEIVQELRLIPIEAMAGFGEGSVEVMEHEGETFKVPTFRGAEFLISVKGSSMYPKYSSGDIVACKKIPLNDLFFQWNKVYVLDTVQGAIIKRIKKGSDENHILLISENPNYDPFELHLNNINAVSIVMGVIRLE